MVKKTTELSLLGIIARYGGHPNMKISTAAVAFATLLFLAAPAKAETFDVVTDPVVVKECGTCHMVFPPETLPKASWQKMIGDLENHFGEDAWLPEETAKHIMDYHTARASDVLNTRAARKWRMNGTPDRIQTADRFIDKHAQCGPDVMAQVAAHEKVKTWANCLACHPDMQRTGDAEDNAGFLPRELQRCFDD